MYPASFEYFAPSTLDEALSVLERYGDEAKVLAGGQSLIPLMKLRFASPRALVDLNGIDGYDGLYEDNGVLNVGALVRHKACERSDLLRSRYGVLADAAPQISDPIVRNLGTVCGSLAHADPQGDWGSVMLAVGADLEARSSAGTRTIPIEELFQGPFTTSLQENEVITGLKVRDPGPKAAGTYLKLERKVGDYATVGVAAQLSLDGDGAISRAGIALTSVNPVNTKVTAAEQVLVGQVPTDDLIEAASKAAAAAADPRDDVRGSAEWKRQVVRTYARRALHTAVEQARAS